MPSPAPPDVEYYRAANAALVAEAQSVLASQLAGLDWGSPDIESIVASVYGAVVQGYRRSSATLGSRMYADLRSAAKVRGWAPKVVVPDAPQGWIDAKVGTAFKVPDAPEVGRRLTQLASTSIPDASPQASSTEPELTGDDITGVFDVQEVVTGRLTNSVQRMVTSGSRETVERTAAEDGAQLTRVPDKPAAPVEASHYIRMPASAKPCAFCVMCAGRTWRPYTSMQSAGFVVGKRDGSPRGSQQAGEKYHDHCMCVAVPVWPGALLPVDDERIAAFAAMYAKGAANAGTHSDVKAVMASMRQIYGLR